MVPGPFSTDVLGNQANRLSGVNSWKELEALGAVNLCRVLDLSRIHMTRLFNEGDFNEARRLRSQLNYLVDVVDSVCVKKPYLPRLRNELFRVGDIVDVYIGDTPGFLGMPWRTASIVSIEKSYNEQWRRDSNAFGWYWRSTVEALDSLEFLPGVHQLSFSTTEPRVLLRTTTEYFIESEDQEFVRIFSKNARRIWQPIWCLELDIQASVENMDHLLWFEELI